MATLAVLFRAIAQTPWPVGGRREAQLGTPLARLAAAAAMLVIGVGSAYLTLWAAYDFRFSAARDPFEAARAESLLRVPPDPILPRQPGHFPLEWNIRRMAALAASPGETVAATDLRQAQDAALGVGGQLALLAARYHLFPEAYLQGLVLARINSAARPSFLRGDVPVSSLFLAPDPRDARGWAELLLRAGTGLARLSRRAERPRTAIGVGVLGTRALALLGVLGLFVPDHVRIPADRYTLATPARLVEADRFVRELKVESPRSSGRRNGSSFPRPADGGRMPENRGPLRRMTA